MNTNEDYQKFKDYYDIIKRVISEKIEHKQFTDLEWKNYKISEFLKNKKEEHQLVL